jgi:hypothetical protein
MTAEALEGIESEIQKFMGQVSSRDAELQGCEVRMLNRTEGRKERKLWNQGHGWDHREDKGSCVE